MLFVDGGGSEMPRYYILHWYDLSGRLLQTVDSGATNRARLAADARRQIGVNRGMSDAPAEAHHFTIEAI